jgi:glycosyltransferase involved in cell wall biosynthesis
MRIALVEPYHGGSHAAWADGLAASSRHQVTLIDHPARFWKWRMHGSFLTLAALLEEDVVANGPPDVVLVSSMTDVAALAGAIRHIAPSVPIAAYFHESQFTYPLSPLDTVDATYAMKNWSSAAVADLVIFNSAYHRDVFHDEARRFLAGFPEYTHVSMVDRVMEASVVLPVGIDVDAWSDAPPTAERGPLIVWNHRWEHDKGPEELLAIVDLLDQRSVDFSMAMCGEVFVSVPAGFEAVLGALGDRLAHRGWLERGRYVELLGSARVVLSTALQEFFGVGVVEAIAAGAHPVLPRRLVYPERVAELGADPGRVLYDSPEGAVDLIVAALDRPGDPGLRPAVERYDWSSVAPRYDDALVALAERVSIRA